MKKTYISNRSRLLMELHNIFWELTKPEILDNMPDNAPYMWINPISLPIAHLKISYKGARVISLRVGLSDRTPTRLRRYVKCDNSMGTIFANLGFDTYQKSFPGPCRYSFDSETHKIDDKFIENLLNKMKQFYGY